MYEVSETVEFVMVFVLVIAGLVGMYFIQRWMDQDETEED